MPKSTMFCAKLFPDKVHLITFCVYIGLFVNQGLLMTASQNESGTYDYNTTLVVILTELVKLIMAVFLMVREEKSLPNILALIQRSFHLFWLYLIPALLYCIYNNLAFVNLSYYDPTTYFILLNFRTVTTGIIFQILFDKKLTLRQWFALIILTIGCIVKQVKFKKGGYIKINLDVHLFQMLLQVFCSSFAGVYNEFLLKKRTPQKGTQNVGAGGEEIPVMMQNVYMYVDSILMNLAFLVYTSQHREVIDNFLTILRRIYVAPVACMIILNNATAGVMTSIFLKKFNSILKTFAGGIELVLTAVACYFLFNQYIGFKVVLSILLVSVALYLYSTQPVQNNKNFPVENVKEVVIGDNFKK